jgi:hypothetical protein
MQNLENIGVTRGVLSRFGTGRRSRGSTLALVKLSKIDDYLADNVRCNRLSEFEVSGQ